MTPTELLLSLRPLLKAECAAEAPGAGMDPADLEQAVWVRLLGSGCPGAVRADPVAWLRRAVRVEARAARRRVRREVPYGPYGDERIAAPGMGIEEWVVAAERWRAVRAAVRCLPGRCSVLLSALLAHKDLTYGEIARELGISQGSVGPLRSRCLAHLRRMLPAEVPAPELGGRER